MHTKRASVSKPNWTWLGWLVGLIALAVFCITVVYPWWLNVSDNGGVFTITFSPADLDLDGDLDVLVHNRRNPGEFEVFAGGALWVNQGGLQGGQEGQLVYQRNEIEGGLASATAELDGDGKPDVLVFDGNRLLLGLNQGPNVWSEGAFFTRSASLSAPASQVDRFGPASQYATLVTGDIDANGQADALVLGCCGRAFKVSEEDPDVPNFSWVWYNNSNVGEAGSANVASLDILEGSPVGEAALADLDGDSDLDLLVLNLKTAAGMILQNDGAGRFSDSGQRLGGTGSNSLALGDLDGDGDPDALLGNGDGVEVWLNQGGMQAGQAGIFVASDSTISVRDTRSLVLADMDNDSDLDALVVGKRRVTLWWNAGQGDFTRSAYSFPCSERQDLTAGDFNGDGWIDIFIAQYDQSAQVWFNDGKGRFRSSIR